MTLAGIAVTLGSIVMDMIYIFGNSQGAHFYQPFTANNALANKNSNIHN